MTTTTTCCTLLPAVSLCGAVVALILVVSETYRCLRYTVQQEMVVDMSREQSMHIDFNITFPALPCRTLRMTLGDSSGNFETESIMEQVQCVFSFFGSSCSSGCSIFLLSVAQILID